MEIDIYGNKKIEIALCMNRLPEELEELGELYKRQLGDDDFLHTKKSVKIEDVHALNYALYRYLKNNKNNIMRGALVGQICRIIEPKKHSLLFQGKPRRLTRWNLVFYNPLFIEFLAGVILGFFYQRGRQSVWRAETGFIIDALVNGGHQGIALQDLYKDGLVLRYKDERIRCTEVIDTWLAYCKGIVYDELVFTGHKPKDGEDKDMAAMAVVLTREAMRNTDGNKS